MAHSLSSDLTLLSIGTHQIIPEPELAKKLSRGTPLIVKLGMDPTSPNLHLGHAVVLAKLRQLQDMGHSIVFLIGDFTARIGDPTGRSKTRPPLSEEQIARNTTTYFEQVGIILDSSRIQVRYNSEWLNALSMKDLIDLCARVTLARLTEREDFANRIAQHQSIAFHELLYPLMQGYDSVVLKADIELGGTDQTFNLLMGRFLQEHYGQEPQVVMTMPLLVGLDGVHKMSKSYNNAIGLTEPAGEAFGKLMSISDDLMWHYATLLLPALSMEIGEMKVEVEKGSLHPMTAKKEIARLIVSRFWSETSAVQAATLFEAVVQKKEYIHAPEYTLSSELPNPIWIVDLLKALQFVQTSSDAKRLIESNAIHIDGTIINDFKAHVSYTNGTIVVAGKHKCCKIIIQ